MVVVVCVLSVARVCVETRGSEKKEKMRQGLLELRNELKLKYPY